MIREARPPDARKVVLYVTQDERLLVFAEPAFPELLLQVPGGTVEDGEEIAAAARRELAEETGILAVTACDAIGTCLYSFEHRGVRRTHERHCFHVLPAQTLPESFSHWERTPSNGAPPIEFAFSWLSIAQARQSLGYGFADMLDPVAARLAAQSRGGRPS
jgi:8-oxo-dGTP pyrophosphatase MutT (NUDIX family)